MKKYYKGNVYMCTYKYEKPKEIIIDNMFFSDNITVPANVFPIFPDKYAKILREDAILLKRKDGTYTIVDVDSMHDRIVTSFPICYGNLFVHEEELVEINDKEQIKSLRKKKR